MNWLKGNIVSIIFGMLLTMMGYILNEKDQELKETKDELKQTRNELIQIKEAVIEIKVKMEANDSQRFDRFEELINDLQTKIK